MYFDSLKWAVESGSSNTGDPIILLYLERLVAVQGTKDETGKAFRDGPGSLRRPFPAKR